MDYPEDPTLGELERQGKIHPDLALLYGRILGGEWRNRRLSEAVEAVIQEGRNPDRDSAGGDTSQIA